MSPEDLSRTFPVDIAPWKPCRVIHFYWLKLVFHFSNDWSGESHRCSFDNFPQYLYATLPRHVPEEWQASMRLSDGKEFRKLVETNRSKKSHIFRLLLLGPERSVFEKSVWSGYPWHAADTMNAPFLLPNHNQHSKTSRSVIASKRSEVAEPSFRYLLPHPNRHKSSSNKHTYLPVSWLGRAKTLRLLLIWQRYRIGPTVLFLVPLWKFDSDTRPFLLWLDPFVWGMSRPARCLARHSALSCFLMPCFGSQVQKSYAGWVS